MTGWQKRVSKLNLDTKFHVVKGFDNCWWIKSPRDSIFLSSKELIDARFAAIDMAKCLNDQRYLLDPTKFPWVHT